MESIIIYFLLACINLPFALDEKNKARFFSWFVIGVQFGFIISNIVDHYR